MNVHKNARLTPQGRLLLVRRISEAGWRVADAATAAGISERQSYRWLARYRSGGAAALAETLNPLNTTWPGDPAAWDGLVTSDVISSAAVRGQPGPGPPGLRCRLRASGLAWRRERRSVVPGSRAAWRPRSPGGSREPRRALGY